MPLNARNRLALFGALWGFGLAILPAALFFDGLSLSPFLVAALTFSALSGAVGAVAAGRRAGRRPGRGRASGVGARQGIVTAVLATFSVWLALTATMTGFSPAAPAKILTLLTDPSIFLQSALAAAVVFAYAVIVGLVLSPLAGAAILRISRGADKTSPRTVGEAG